MWEHLKKYHPSPCITSPCRSPHNRCLQSLLVALRSLEEAAVIRECLFQEKSCAEQYKGAQAKDILLKSLFVLQPIKSLIPHCWQADKNTYDLIGYFISIASHEMISTCVVSRGKKWFDWLWNKNRPQRMSSVICTFILLSAGFLLKQIIPWWLQSLPMTSRQPTEIENTDSGASELG